MVRLLLDLGVLARVAGDEDAFVRRDGDALYDVERRVLATLLATPRGPSVVTATGPDERLDALVAELPAATDELRNRRSASGSPAACSTSPCSTTTSWTRPSSPTSPASATRSPSRITEPTGLVAEVRAEGVAMVDPHDDLTDVRMPESGTDGHVTLLLAEHLAGAGPTPLPRLHAFVRDAARAARRVLAARRHRRGGGGGAAPRRRCARLEALRLVEATRAGGDDRATPCPRWRATPSESRRSARESRHDDCRPSPTRTRWQPLRAGLVDLFYYDARSSASTTAGCCCGATTAPASRRSSR